MPRLTGLPRATAARARAVPVLLASPLFDEAWYAAQAGRRARTRLEAVVHYLAVGRRQGWSPHPLLEPAWWDPRPGEGRRRDPVTAYRLTSTLRSPHPLFDAARWAAEQPAARAHPDGPLGHWLAQAGPRTPLPTPDLGGHRADLTWGEARTRLEALLGAWQEGQRLRRAPRTSEGHDRARGDAERARLAAAPLPPRGDGPLVSVVVPVRDRAGVVGTAVASVLAQDLDDWELLVVDDGSADGSADAARAAAAGDPRVRVLEEPPGGVGRARDAGTAAARGRYLAWLDSDNAWHPHHLRTVLAALAGARDRGVRAAYAVLEQRDGERTTYRALDAGPEHLAVANHVDLNVLVAERALVQEVGGFDEGLRRAVDYDLVLRLAARTRLLHVPVVTAVYDARRDAGRSDRLTVRELPSWSDVVRARRLVDWEGLAARRRAPGRTSVLVPARDAAADVLALADGVLRHGGGDVEVLVADAGSGRAQAVLTGALALLSPALRVRAWPGRATPGFATSLALEGATGATAVLLDPAARVHAGWLAPLRAALEDGAAAAAPLLLAGDGTVRSAGLDPVPHADLPAPALHGLPPADAARAGARPVPAAEGVGLALRTADLVAAGGADPLFTGLAAAGADLAAALAAGGGAVVVDPASVVTAGAAAGWADAAADRRLLAERARDRGAVPGPVRAPAAPPGLAVAGHRRALPAGAGPLERGVPLPVHVRDRTAGTGLRWALKTAAPAGPAGDRWGDRHFALALAAALERLGEQAVVDPLPAHERPSAHLDDVVLCLRGKAAVAPPAAGLSVLWVISHPGLVTDEELLAHDVVCAAGPAWAARAAERTGREVVVLLQATDPARFHPGAAGAAGAASAGGDEVVFVGNSRGVQRPVVRDLLAAGVDVALHGAGWERFVPPSRVRSTHVPNEELSALYGSAGVVLNDHWDDMRADGFLSNRLFDAAASGARVVTDAVLDQPGLDRLFHGLVRAYADRDDLLALVAERAGFPDDAERARRGALVGREHSFDARARELVRRVHGLRGLHGGVPVLG